MVTLDDGATTAKAKEELLLPDPVRYIFIAIKRRGCRQSIAEQETMRYGATVTPARQRSRDEVVIVVSLSAGVGVVCHFRNSEDGGRGSLETVMKHCALYYVSSKVDAGELQFAQVWMSLM